MSEVPVCQKEGRVMQPSVSVVMLCSPNRDAMRARAIESIRRQTYSPIQIVTHESRPGVTIGALRNEAIERAFGEIIVHADDDDVSGERRVEEQVALLVASKADACGYRECLFWDSRPGQFCGAWIYRSPDTTYAIGASLCFWRKTWERVPFPDLPKPDSNHSEDWHFTKRVKTLGVSGIGEDGEPRLICSVHGQNSANYSWLGKNKRLRAPEHDEYCRSRMELK